VLDPGGSLGLFVFGLASIPALPGGVTRRPSFWRALALFAAVVSISAVLLVSFYVVILIAAAQCPDDAYECPL
jgi:hypothetical protein